jgi:protein involved in polysaccharide export with SLBB domain
MTPVVGELCYAVIMDTILIARTHAMVHWECWFDRVMDGPRIGVLSLTPAAGARPMKECSARYHAPAKAAARTQCGANAPNVFSRRSPPRGITLGIGDVMSITIFEAEAGGLFLPSEAGARPGNFVTMPDQIVDSDGNITVPYAGTIRAAGRRPLEVQQAIIEALTRR